MENRFTPGILYPFVRTSSPLVALTEVEAVSALSDSSNQLSISNSEISVIESPIIELKEPDFCRFADDEQNPYDYYSYPFTALISLLTCITFTQKKNFGLPIIYQKV